MSGVYTRARAVGLKRKLDHRMAQIEDLTVQMRTLVPDSSVSFDRELDAVRARMHELHAVIDRRTRQPQ